VRKTSFLEKDLRRSVEEKFFFSGFLIWADRGSQLDSDEIGFVIFRSLEHRVQGRKVFFSSLKKDLGGFFFSAQLKKRLGGIFFFTTLKKDLVEFFFFPQLKKRLGGIFF